MSCTFNFSSNSTISASNITFGDLSKTHGLHLVKFTNGVPETFKIESYVKLEFPNDNIAQQNAIENFKKLNNI
jgi:hypothetical protein